MATTLKKAKDVKAAPLVATGLIGGRLTAREIGIHPLSGVVLGAADVYTARTWNTKTGVLGATGLTAAYLGALGLPYPLAKKTGA